MIICLVPVSDRVKVAPTFQLLVVTGVLSFTLLRSFIGTQETVKSGGNVYRCVTLKTEIKMNVVLY